MSKLTKALLVLFGVLLLDQGLKIWIKTNMFIGQEFNVIGNFFILHFTENNGMAFGFELAGDYGKIILSLFRIAAVGAIAWFLYKLTKKEESSMFLIVSVTLVLAGAIGNILDSAFYGIIFNESYYQVASIFPDEGGYSSFLHGRVVDMLYFPILEGHFPSWFPIWANEEFIFFRPVFNIADSSITVGVLLILLFQRNIFNTKSIDNKEVAIQAE
ncbi:MAG: lipoprotein signal peptidase [Bacteroidetes bacterium GWA2_31_9]|nr:MAG: lipoprotein signal peptidase [Bacteroidetes bacterium GWA2_31_9]